MLAKFVLASAVLIIGLPRPTHAHDPYTDLTDLWGKSCCDNRDCRPAPYRFVASHWQMFVDERWIDVPDHTIQFRALPDDSGETDGGHWCGFARVPSEAQLDLIYTTRCAILPPKDASAQIDHFGISGR